MKKTTLFAKKNVKDLTREIVTKILFSKGEGKLTDLEKAHTYQMRQKALELRGVPVSFDEKENKYV